MGTILMSLILAAAASAVAQNPGAAADPTEDSEDVLEPAARSGPIAGAETRSETITVKKEHTVVVANTLWDMAAFYYEDPWKWPVIYDANKDRIKDPHWIYPGQQFIIPGLDHMVTVVKEIPKNDAPAPAQIRTPPPEPEPEEVPVEYKPEEGKDASILPDSLSVNIPERMTGQQPAMYRMRMPTSWEADGSVVEFRGRESIVAEGDFVSVLVNAGVTVRKSQRFVIYRRAGITEADQDKQGNVVEGKYVQKVGMLEIVRKLKGREYRARILKSGDSVQVNDLLKREE